MIKNKKEILHYLDEPHPLTLVLLRYLVLCITFIIKTHILYYFVLNEYDI